jgi:hypothetical protein
MDMAGLICDRNTFLFRDRRYSSVEGRHRKGICEVLVRSMYRALFNTERFAPPRVASVSLMKTITCFDPDDSLSSLNPSP